MKFILKFCPIGLILATVVTSTPTPPSNIWKEVSIGLYRTVGSATFAADKIGVRYLRMLKAYERIEPPKDEYLVYFKAICVDGREKTCEAVVDWTYLGRVLKTGSCLVGNATDYN